MKGPDVEVLFYHLQSRSLEQSLPALLEKTLQRNWRALVRCGSQERLAALDNHLWTYADESFLPHGPASDRDGAPIQLSLDDARPEGANVIFCVDGAALPSTDGWDRVVLMFDGNDPDALAQARLAWKDMKARGTPMTYWRQDDQGRWSQQA
ncbi:MAG: DNA polymerase III subunit chi [Beijerinckiaceae bacterium]